MLENGKVEIKREVKDGCVIESFVYDHQRAIEGYKPVDVYCQVNIDIPNTYLKSILDFFESEDFRFSDRKTHRNDDKFILEETDSVIISYICQINESMNHVNKLRIKDGDKVSIHRNEIDSKIIEVLEGEEKIE